MRDNQSLCSAGERGPAPLENYQLIQCPEGIALRMVWHFWHCDPDYGRWVAEGVGVDLERAKGLPPLDGHPARGEDRPGPTYSDGQAEEGSR
ncbi:hypothetical protein [Azotobacter salinestris]|uniref:hypothetical protein n=1 Tax=Azotobacter salinestris TaxID=69964 RepID=UPI001AD6619A|nr:hypothetical protein [Azotobacter salinestris]